ncbi:MAG: hypothetical protein ACJ8D5_02905 [Sphingomicrobium sp.]
MAYERERDEDIEGTEGSSGGQPIGGNDNQTGSGTTLSQGADVGGQSSSGQSSSGQAGTGSEPPRSMGTRGSEFGQFGDATGPAGQQGQSGTGQADLGSQADTTLAGRTDQQDLGTDQPGRVGGAGSSGPTGKGFIGAQGTGSDDDLQDQQGSSRGAASPSGADATGGSDFARQGRGALDEESEEDESGAGSTGGGFSGGGSGGGAAGSGGGGGF